MSGEISSKLFEKLKVYKNYSNDCIFFKYIFDENDIPDEENKKSVADTNVFKPEYTHQIFGDEEIIFGYKNLRIDYFLTPGNLDAYIGLSYKEKVSPQKFDGIEPDDVYHAFSEFGCSPGFTRNLNVFRSEKLVQDLEFRPFGTKINEYTRESIKNETRYTGKYEIYKVDSSMPEFESQKFIDYISRVQTILVYFIETSNFLDTEDTQWTHYLLYEKNKNQSSISSSSNSQFRYATIGYLSVYNYYAYPDKTRSRISQIMIFPNYQNMGHGAELIEAVYRDAIQNPSIIDVTAESPSQEFIRVRDYVTTKMCLSLDSYRNRDQLKKGYNNDLMLDALKKLKLPKLQSRRCYEILRLSATNQNVSDEWTCYRLDLKKRFYLPFIRKSKYARNNKNAEGGENQSVPEKATVQPVAQKSALEGRFGGGSSRFDAIEEETTIGFGKNAKPAPSTTTMFINTGGSANRFTNGKSAVKSVKFTSMNTSNSTTDSNGSDDENENDENQGLSQANLFVSEQERKKYLEEQFQESLNDYNKTIKRLEHANLI